MKYYEMLIITDVLILISPFEVSIPKMQIIIFIKDLGVVKHTGISNAEDPYRRVADNIRSKIEGYDSYVLLSQQIFICLLHHGKLFRRFYRQ